MRDYVPKELYVDREAYKQVLSVVRRYELMRRRMHETSHDIILSAPIFRGVGGIARPSESKAILIEERNREYERQTKAVEQAMICLDPEIREIVLNHIMSNAPLKRKGVTGRDRTVERRKQEFIHMVAYNLRLI